MRSYLQPLKQLRVIIDTRGLIHFVINYESLSAPTCTRSLVIIIIIRNCVWQVTEAFRIISEDAKVKAILVNVFGGIVNCATIANGIVNACRTINLRLPLVVRLEGTNVDAAKKILSDSGLPIQR